MLYCGAWRSAKFFFWGGGYGSSPPVRSAGTMRVLRLQHSIFAAYIASRIFQKFLSSWDDGARQADSEETISQT